MDEKDDEQLWEFDPNIPEEGPSAPPPGWLDCVSGYDEPKAGDSGDQLYPPPPAYNPQPENDRNASVPHVRVPQVSEDVAREALLKFVGSKWSKSTKPARNLTFKELKPVTVYRYRLETYTESRSSAWEMEPYTGQVVDGPQCGRSPPPWDVPVQQPQRYTDVTLKVRVPHSSFVKTCHRCHGCGRTRCTHCAGRGNVHEWTFFCIFFRSDVHSAKDTGGGSLAVAATTGTPTTDVPAVRGEEEKNVRSVMDMATIPAPPARETETFCTSFSSPSHGGTTWSSLYQTGCPNSLSRSLRRCQGIHSLWMKMFWCIPSWAFLTRRSVRLPGKCHRSITVSSLLSVVSCNSPH
ncbi:protein SSUH2 homolog isoform X5 [Esox lucius]|uniref:protein SSUH2 homolog isoform X5 n=1 Tax=Esox lucius TaxID=8010 RepID=UPI000661BBF5|nr:protein SSUH2 homolog isoform X5 [Esox lucius]